MESREVARGALGFRKIEVIASETNKGLSRSVVDGVSKILDSHPAVIVVEDDLEVSPGFLAYMNRALRLYEADEKVCSIHGYVYPIREELPETFFLEGADCWGWATWRRAWTCLDLDGRRLLDRLKREGDSGRFDLDGAFPFSRMLEDQVEGRNDSWAIRWHASNFLASRLTLYPGRTLVQNHGFDGTGRHSPNGGNWNSRMTEEVQVERIPLEVDAKAREAFGRHLRRRRSLAARAASVLRDRTRRLLDAFRRDASLDAQ